MNEAIIPYQARNDLTSFKRSRDHDTYFVVADKIRNQYTELSEIEFFIFEFLKDESKTFGQLTRSLADCFGAEYSNRQIVLFLERLFSLNLVSRPGFDAGNLLFRQRQNLNRANFKRFIFGWLSVKIPGFYPGPVLRTLQPIGSLLFSRVALVCFAIATLATVVYALLNFPTIASNVPGQAQWLSVDHIFMVVCAYIMVKIIHELGHGLACQRIGHECSEMGLIFLVFMPCLYCDVSDVWTQENKWKRIFVSAAGVLVEIAVAVFCFWAWWFVDDGKLATLLFSVMMITSLNTLFINGNPLMRFDGYYVLSDFLEIPNLANRASAVLRSYITGFVLVEADPEDEQRPGVLLFYAIAAVCYRWFILISIGIAIWYFFQSYQLPTLGMMAMLFLAVTILVPILSGWSQIRRAQYVRLNYPGLAFVMLLGAGLCLLILAPFSYRIWSQAEFQLAEPQQVFATSDGFFDPRIDDGDDVEVGTVIGQIDVPDNALRKSSLLGELREVQTLLAAAEMYDQTPATASEREFLEERQRSLQAMVHEFEGEEAALTIRSKRQGRFVAARHPIHEIAALRNENINAFEPASRNAFVGRGALLGYVGSRDQIEGRFEVLENEIDKLSVGDLVKIHDPRFQWTGKVSRISLENTLTGDQQLAKNTEIDRNVYVVTFQVDPDSRLIHLPVGAQRKIVVHAGTTNLLGSLLKKMNINLW